MQAFATEVAEPFAMDWRLDDAGRAKRVAVLVSREDHCLLDLLWRHRRGELHCEIPVVISNHPDHASDVEDQQARGAREHRGARQLDERAVMSSSGAHHGHAVPQIEREHDVLRADGTGHGGEGLERRQRFQADDDLRGAGGADVSRPPRVGDARVHEQRGAESRDLSQQAALDGAASDGIEIGDVAVRQTQGVPIDPRQRDGIARPGLGAGEHRSDGRVALAPAAARQHRATPGEIDHRDHAQ